MNEEKYFRVSDLRKLCDDSRDWGVPTFTADDLREHGHWVHHYDKEEWYSEVCECSNCNGVMVMQENWKYCPYCGAKMDERREDADT